MVLKMRKHLFCILLYVFLTANLFCVFANDTEQIITDFTVRQSGAGIIVSGVVSDAPGKSLSLILTPHEYPLTALTAAGLNKTSITGLGETAADENGGFQFFVKMRDEDETGLYNVYVGVEEVVKLMPDSFGYTSFKYININHIYVILGSLKEAESTAEFKTIFDAIDADLLMAVDIDVNEYTALEEAQKEKVCAFLKSLADDNDLTPAMFSEGFKKYVCIVEINDSVPGNAMEILEKYKDYLDIDIVAYEDAYVYFCADARKLSSSIEDIRQAYELAVKKASALNKINSADVTAMYGILTTDCAELDGWDISSYKALSSVRRNVVDMAMTGKNFPYIDDARKAFKDILSEAKSTVVQTGVTGGSGRGVSGSAITPSLPIDATAKYDAEAEKIIEFKDIDGFDWAKDAVEYMVATGIVNGYEDGTFRPSQGITREEFIKLIITAYGLEGKKASTFTDVEAGSWYEPYVAAAQALGIVKGDSDNRFGVGRYISRQDIAVIVYRMIQLQGPHFKNNTENVEYLDKSSFQNYAVESIEQLTKWGIINGVEDHYFNPEGICTRAQATVIIYRILLAEEDAF
jgi:hypothetical protein